MSTVVIHHYNQTVNCRADRGTNLLTFLREQGLSPDAPCGGGGTCGKCTVGLKSAPEAPITRVLSCQTQVTGDCEVFLEAAFEAEVGAETIATGAYTRANPGEKPSSPAPAGPSASQQDRALSASSRYAAAIDLGTTTVAITVYELTTGESSADLGAWNAQIPYGADVISRVKYCMDHPNGLAELSALLRQQIGKLLDQSIGTMPESMVVAGNTIMQHLFAGIDPSPIARAPFRPLSFFDQDEVYHYPEFKSSSIHFLPCIAGYVGGDITAGLYLEDFLHREGLTLFLDIGTNGEMALGNKDGILCCSVASGPAFEGAEITCGMRSTEGAIRHFQLSGGLLKADVVGGKAATGICGSGLIDLMAILLQEEIVDETGLLPGPDEVPRKWSVFVEEDENENGIFSVTRAIPYFRSKGEIVFTAADVRKLQLAKAAVRAGIEILLKRSGHSYDDVQEVIIAGGFGTHLSPDNMAVIGMIPEKLCGKVRAAGNTSLQGAGKLLLSMNRTSENAEAVTETENAAPARAVSPQEELQRLCGLCTYLELSTDSDFSREYVEQMYF